MRYRVTVAATAKADLAGTVAYISESSPDAAERWFQGADQAIAALGNFAGYAPAREAAVLGRPLRQRVFGSHRIVFEVDEDGALVTVLFVRHAARHTVGEADDGPTA